jgi:integrase
MPRLSQSTPRWALDLRGLIKRQHGNGWSIREQSAKVKLTRRWADGGSSSVMLDLPWASTSATAVLAQLEAIKQRMDQSGLSLAQAAGLQARSVATASASGFLSAKSDSINWEAVVKNFGAHKTTHTGDVKQTTWKRMYAPVMRQVLEVVGGRPAPRTGRDVLAQLRDSYGGTPGSAGRRHRIQYAAQLLRYAVNEMGAADRWLPPDELNPFIGKRISAKPDATPLRDEQLVRLLAGITDGRWHLAIGLLGCFGLRPVELKHCRATKDGQRLNVTYRKRTARGSTRPREVTGLDPIGAPGLSAQLLQRLVNGDGLPPLGSADSETASAVDTFLRRRKEWGMICGESAKAGEKITVYSLRHGYALRAHEVGELSPRVAATLMGHSLQTHFSHYGRWCDADTVAHAMARAQQRLNARQAEAQDQV